MVIYSLLLALCLYCFPVYPYSTLLSSTASFYSYGNLLPSTGSLSIPMVLYYLLLAPCLSLWNSSYYILLAPWLSTLHTTIFYRPTACIYGTLLSSTGSLLIPMVLYYLSLPIHVVLYLLLSLCLYLCYSTIFQVLMPIPLVLNYLLRAHCLHKWYSTVFYWPPAYTYDTLLSSTGSMPIPMVIYCLLMAPAYPLGTLLSSSGPMPISWYSTVFYWLPAYTYGTLLPSASSLPIPMTL